MKHFVQFYNVNAQKLLISKKVPKAAFSYLFMPPPRVLILLVQRIKGLRKRTEGHSCGRLRHENINRSGTISSRSLRHCSRFPKFSLAIGWRQIPPKSNKISLERLRGSRMENVGYLVATSFL